MARTLGQLNAAQLGRLRPGMHSDGGGLYLLVSKTGARSWIYRYMLDRRAREMGLGPLHTISLAEARRRAAAARLAKLDGGDPIEARRAERRSRDLAAARTISFRGAAERHIAATQAEWKNAKHAAQWAATLQAYAYPLLGALPVAAIDTPLVLQVLEPIWRRAPETASRVRGRIEAVLDGAAARGERPPGDNPARWRGHLDKILPTPAKTKRAVRQAAGRQEHHAALPYAEIAGFMALLRQQPGSAARALEFAILTAARTGEVLGARHGEIDRQQRLWTVPGDRMKAGREHRVPLSDAALRLLGVAGGDVAGGDAPLFAGAAGGRLSNMALLMLLRRLGRGDLTAHGFRSSFCDWVGEATNFPEVLAEMALAHQVGDKVKAAYRRGDAVDKRRRLMDAWAAYCGRPESPGASVAPLRRRA